MKYKLNQDIRTSSKVVVRKVRNARSSENSSETRVGSTNPIKGPSPGFINTLGKMATEPYKAFFSKHGRNEADLSQMKNNTISRDSTADETSRQSTSFAYLGAKLERHNNTSLKPITGSLHALSRNETQVPERSQHQNETSGGTGKYRSDKSNWRWNCVSQVLL